MLPASGLRVGGEPEQRQLFNNDLTTVLAALSQRQHPEAATPAPMERIA